MTVSELAYHNNTPTGKILRPPKNSERMPPGICIAKKPRKNAEWTLPTTAEFHPKAAAIGIMATLRQILSRSAKAFALVAKITSFLVHVAAAALDSEFPSGTASVVPPALAASRFAKLLLSGSTPFPLRLNAVVLCNCFLAVEDIDRVLLVTSVEMERGLDKCTHL
eukprot:711758-Prorocentrum_minimum.AAC.1